MQILYKIIKILKIFGVSTSKINDQSFTCACGKVFETEVELARHAAYTARVENKNGEYQRALEHINLRFKYRFSTEHIEKGILNLENKMLEKIESKNQFGHNLPFETTVVYVDGSGDTVSSGTFRCGLGINVVEGAKLSFSLPGGIQIVVRVELMAILVAMLMTDREDDVVIKLDSEIPCNLFNKGEMCL